ncbi:MAG: pyrimidine dimer DNA glycosylase/endonuclease V [Nanoarchaeota archaeon]
MNIFVLHKNPKKAARMLCDQHVVKMILESGQMLCTAHWETGSKALYKATHKNHPCTIWTRESIGNYKWLVKHSFEMCKEYTRRYGRIHKTQEIIKWNKKNTPNLKKKRKTPFVQAMPDKYKDKDAIKAYRNFYLGEKMRFAKWKCGRKW